MLLKLSMVVHSSRSCIPFFRPSHPETRWNWSRKLVLFCLCHPDSYFDVQVVGQRDWGLLELFMVEHSSIS